MRIKMDEVIRRFSHLQLFPLTKEKLSKEFILMVQV